MIPPGPAKTRLYSYGRPAMAGGEVSCSAVKVWSLPTLGLRVVVLTHTDPPESLSSQNCTGPAGPGRRISKVLFSGKARRGVAVVTLLLAHRSAMRIPVSRPTVNCGTTTARNWKSRAFGRKIAIAQ